MTLIILGAVIGLAITMAINVAVLSCLVASSCMNKGTSLDG